MSRNTSSRRSRRSILIVPLLALLALGGFASNPTWARPPDQTYRTANGIPLQVGDDLPIFRMQTPPTSGGGAVNLAQQFSSIYSRQAPLPDSYRGLPRFTVPQTATGSILEQYGATGGFYAYNAPEAFGESAIGSLTTLEAAQRACGFLVGRQFMGIDGELIIGHDSGQLRPQFSALTVPPPGDCSQPPYAVTPLWANSQTPGGGPAAPQMIGAVVEIPMSLDTGQFSQTPGPIPVAGAGGHISLLFRPTSAAGPPTFSLDSSVAGLGAIAMPFYGRSLSFNRNVPAIDPVAARSQVEQQVRSSYPGASSVVVPLPNLLYMADEAGKAPGALEPALNFTAIQVTVGGETFVLRDINVPAAQSGAGGFGPAVAITAPANGSSFAPGSAVTFGGAILDGAPPYSYTWALGDGTILDEGVLADPGVVGMTTDQLPAVSHGGTPAATTVLLTVTDQEGAVRSTQVALTPTVAPALFMPFVRQPGDPAPGSQPPAAPLAPAAPAWSNYSFGIEAGWDYPPYGPGGSDLPGVVPDAYGFRSGMLGYGWNQRFFWSNASAWERDWRDCSLGGADCTYGVDRADFVYYTGHGSTGGLSLPSNVNSTWFPGSKARYSSLRWAGFSSCLTLRVQGYAPPNEPIRQWFNAFQGAHMLLGFNSVMADIAFGGPLLDNMRMPTFWGVEFPWAQKTISEAWVLTAFTMNAGKPAYIYAVGTNGVNPAGNKLPQAHDSLLPRPYPVASWHWVWWDE